MSSGEPIWGNGDDLDNDDALTHLRQAPFDGITGPHESLNRHAPRTWAELAAIADVSAVLTTVEN